MRSKIKCGRAGFSVLLTSTSFAALILAAGSALAQEATPVPPVSVTAPQEDSSSSTAQTSQALDGSAAAGYRVGASTATGPFWGDLPLQDAPYSITVVPAQMIQNEQAYDVQTALRYAPGVQSGNNAQNTTGTSSFTIRGFNFAGSPGSDGQTLDGLVGQGQEEFAPVEDKDRIEVLNGVNGFLYGVGNVGGNINLVLKRPTEKPYYEFDLGDNTGANYYMHADMGGPLKIPGLVDGLFGYRLNLVYQDGDTSYPGQSVKRNLESVAIDVHLPYGALLQLNASHSDYVLFGNTPYFLGSSINGVQVPPANPATIQALPWLEHSDQSNMVGAGLNWKINDIFTARVRWNFLDEAVNPAAVMYASILNDTGAMTEKDYGGGTPNNYYTHSGYAFLDANFSVLGIQNKVTTGFNGFYYWDNKGDGTYVSPTTIYSCNFYSQTSTCSNFNASPSYTSNLTYITGNNYATNFMLGDEVKFWDKLILLAGANYAGVGSESFSSTGDGAVTSAYQSAALTPTVALIYKALPWLSTYVSYQQSLSPGTVVANSGSVVYTNNGAVLPPYLGTQYEGGIKATVATNVLATLALFYIDRANLYTQTNSNGTMTELEGGSQIGQGIEMTMTGKITRDLTVFGGLTLENPRVENNPSSPWQNGQLAQDASPITFKLYSEYTLPFISQAPWAHGLTLTGGFSYIGPFAGSLPSSYAGIATIPYYPGYAVGDLGFRYATTLYGHLATLRFTVTNVTNHAYWAAAGLEGAPRTFLASAEMKW